MGKFFDEKMLKELTNDAYNVWPKKFSDYEKVFNKCCLAICIDVIKKLGLFSKPGDKESVEGIKSKIGLANQAEYLFNKILYILLEEKVLSFDGKDYQLIKYPDIEGASELLVKVTRDFPEEGAPFQWLARSYSSMIDFIKGEALPEDIMFPWGSFELVEDVYYSSEVYGFYSKLAGIVVKKLIDNVFKKDITLLEVGSGTGNGSAMVFNNTTKFEKYYFTDISRSLLRGSKKRFEAYDFIDYKLFDITKDYKDQGFENETIDIILAVNVLHATNNVLDVVKKLKKLLKPGGILVNAEIAPPPSSIYRYMELTFGLLPSYNTYDDKDERPISPIIRPEQWCDVYKKAGFVEAEAIPQVSDDFSDRGGVIIGINK